jgi:uncharacterized protein YqeY
MSLLDQLKKDALAARKAADRLKSTLLSTLIGEAGMVGKNAGNRESNDEEVAQTLRKFLKNNQEAIAVIKDEARLATLRAEADILASYLPTMATEAEIRAVIADTLATLAEPGPKAIGMVMGALKARFGANFDARQANVWVKEGLS